LVGYLGLVAAYANLRTVILDADMRRPCQHHLLQMPRFPGLTDYLQKEAELDQVIHSTKLENLKFIPGGNTVSSPTELLQIGISDVKVLLDQCYIHFDVVLVDVPPVVPVHDAESLGPLVDGVALIVMSGKTYREIIERAVELLRKSDCHLLGLILNNMTRALPYYYEPKYYHYPYAEEKRDA
jgi:capsular exopolysaccharide synthesis family protein